MKEKNIDWSQWVSHALVVISTVLGVYLAASEGFKTAVKFDAMKTAKSHFHLRSNLEQELMANLVAVEETIKISKRDGQFRKDRYPTTALNKYVWNAMQQHETSLQTPARLLNQVQQFYSQVDSLIDLADRKVYNGPELAYQLEALLAEFKKESMPQLADSITEVEKELARYGVSIESQGR